MSSQHTTFEASHAAASAVFLDSVTRSILVTHQTSCDAANSVVGYNLQTGNNATLVSTVKTANIAKLEALANAEKTRQASIAAARETLKNAGTSESAGPF
jgi:hypothetical protein